MAWRIHLLGKVEAVREGRTLSHFESARVIALLARLALYPRRVHPREELVELLWPDVEAEAARGRLRRALLVLRRQLEDGLPSGSVLVADRRSVRLNRETFATDVADFEQAVAKVSRLRRTLRRSATRTLPEGSPSSSCRRSTRRARRRRPRAASASTSGQSSSTSSSRGWTRRG
ncbi:MAG TPA: hypothetical protein VM490_14045 [Armatimonadaceae bacterium]|nr:hypothetical protein [Armatimonadaceae bacterium]